jgi:predicted ester cyclase
MALKGFDTRWNDFPHYILGITKEIWEERQMATLQHYYAHDMILRTAPKVVFGNQNVISDTMSTLAEFPDRQLLGEDVIWSGDDKSNDLLSSHRLLSIATHSGTGRFGKPTGKSITFRTIADCAAKNNTIYDEWLVRDQGAIVRQMGLNIEEFVLNSIFAEGGFSQCSQPLSAENNPQGPYTSKGNDNPWGALYADILSRIMNADISVIQKLYNRAVHAEIPGGKQAHGWGQVENFWMGLRASFPSATLSIDHVIGREDSGMPPRAALRWSLSGTHDGWGAWGAPSGASVYIFGISHAEFGNVVSPHDTLRREYVVYDETAIWKQILMHKG